VFIIVLIPLPTWKSQRLASPRWSFHRRTPKVCMMLLGQESIRNVILFPQLKPK